MPISSELTEALSRMLEASVDTGVAAASSAVDHLDDAAKNWPVNAFTNLIVEITGGTGVDQVRKIASNTATSLVPVTNFATAPDATSTYRIGFYGKMAGDITHWGGTALTGRDVSLDLKALTDDSIKGLLKSIGDIAALENLITRLGETTDAIVAAGATGSLSAKLRRVTQGLEDLKTLIVLAAGSAIIGKVGIDQTTPGTTDRVTANVDKVAGTAQTGADWTPLLQKLDVALSTRALEAGGNLAGILAKLDVALSTRALEAGGNLAGILAKLDVALSTRATEITLAKLIPIAKAAIFNTALPAAEAGWLGAAISPTNSPSFLRIHVTVAAAGILRVARTVGGVTVDENLNSANALVANAAYIFDVEWRTGDSLNFEYSVTDANILVFRADEIGGAA